jgi:hypothetical protein
MQMLHLHASVPISSSFLGSALPFSLFGLRPHLRKRAVVAITPQTPPSPLLCGCSQGWDVDMLVPDDKPAIVRTAEHYRQYRQQLARKGVTKKRMPAVEESQRLELRRVW